MAIAEKTAPNMEQALFYGILVSWHRGGREMFRYPTADKARVALNYLKRQHPDVKDAVFVGRHAMQMPA